MIRNIHQCALQWKNLNIFGGSRYTVHVTERIQRNCATGACAIVLDEMLNSECLVKAR